jgi:hypothetical protein
VVVVVVVVIVVVICLRENFYAIMQIFRTLNLCGHNFKIRTFIMSLIFTYKELFKQDS